MPIKLEMSEQEAKTFGTFVIESAPEVEKKLRSFALWNRADLRDQLVGKLRAANLQHLLPDNMPIPAERQIGSEVAVPGRLNVRKKPLANPKNLIIHRKSVVAFLLASPGHAFSGVAMIGHVRKTGSVLATKSLKVTRTELEGRPKIFLCPVRQTTITTGSSTSTGYVPKEYGNPRRPLGSITNPEDRSHAESVRSWYYEHFGNTEDLNRGVRL